MSGISVGHFVVAREINLRSSKVILNGSECSLCAYKMGADCPAPLLCLVFTFVNPHFAISDPFAVMFSYFLTNLVTFSPLFL